MHNLQRFCFAGWAWLYHWLTAAAPQPPRWDEAEPRPRPTPEQVVRQYGTG